MNKISKAKMCWLMLAIMLFSFSNKIFSQTVNLGILETFEGYTVAGAITNAAGATWTGDAGTNIGVISGFSAPPFFNGNIYSANTVTAQCRVDLFRLYIHLNDLFVNYPSTHAPAFGAGETLTPGVYSIPGAGSIGAVLTLDGGGNSNAFFVIKFYGAMTVGVGATINLIGGTKSSNVFFIADGTISVAASANIKGTLFAKVGAVGLGEGAILEGRMFSLEGAIVAGAGATVSRPPNACTIPIFCESNFSPAAAVDVLGVLSNYALYTNVGAVSNTSTSGIDGNIGTNVGAVSGFESSVVAGSYHTADFSTAQANLALNNAYNSLMALPNTVLTHPAVFGNVAPGGETINAGVYFIEGAGSLGGTLVLDAQNNPNAIFIFKFAGAFSVAVQSKMILINGASRCNVFFIGGAGVATGAISIGAGAVLKGTFLSHGGACGSGASVFLEGRQLSTDGAIVTYSGIIYNNPVCITSTSLEPPIAPTGNSPQTFCSSSNPTVSNLVVTATGTVIWYTAATGGSVVTASTALVNGTHYYASQTINNSESTTRFDVTVILNSAPAITTQPTAPTTTCSGTGSQTLSVTAIGTGLTYSWRKAGVALTNGTVISGQGTNTLTLTSPTISDAGSYDVIVSGTCTPSVISIAVIVNVNSATAIITQPTAPTATCSGTGSQILSVTAIGAGLTYSWRKDGLVLTNGIVISGQGTNTLTLTSPTILDAGSYDVIISGACTSSVISSVVSVTVNSALTISATDITGVYIGAGTCTASVYFGANVSTTGAPAPTLIYKFNSSSITSPYIFPVGTSIVTVFATNSCTTASTSFAVTVIDNQNPTIATLLAISVPSDAGLCTYASTQLTKPTTADNCIVAGVLATPAILVKGANTVTWSVTDGSGNTATSTQIVTVTDNQNPSIATLSSISVPSDAGVCTYASSQLTKPTTADNCIVASVLATPVILVKGANTVSWTVTDGSGNTATSTQIVTVTDNQNPTIATLLAISVSSDAGVCTYASSQLTKPTIGDNCSVASVLATPVILVKGANTVTWTVTDGSGNTATSTQTVTVTSIKTTTTVTVSPNPRQYSDEVTFVARVTSCGENVTGGIVTFKVGTQTMGTAPVLADGTATLIVTLNEQFVTAFTPQTAPTGQMSPGVKTVTASFAAINGSQVSTGTTSLTITQEDAIPYYTGSSFVYTASTSSTCVPVLLSANIKDIASVAGSGDNKAGNIRNARVRFVNRDIADPMNTNAVTSASGYYISDWLTPGLVIATDTTTGFVSANWSAPIGSSIDGIQFTLGIIIDNGYYIRNSSTDDAVINVSKPLTAFVTCGGYINMTNSFGSINPQQGLRNNFGFIIKSNSYGVLNGNLNSIIRCTNGKVYQVKANAMVSLSVTPATSTSGAKAVFTGKANWQDITNPSRPILAFFGTNLLQVTVNDRGEPGNTDDISIVMWDNSNNLLFSSKWDGTITVPQVMDGGNIKIHNSASVITGSAQSIAKITSSLNPAAQGLSVKFTATITSSNTIKPTGTVTFVDVSNNNLVLATLALSTTGIVTYSTSSLTVGTHSIIGYYSGDSRYGVSSNQITQLISGVTSLKVTPIIVAKVATTKVEVGYIPLQIAIGPVPSTGKFTLQVLTSSNEVIDMIVLDIYGQVIQKTKLANGSTIDFGSNYLVGSYFVQVIQGKQKVFRKIIKS